jgi:hypothetical protein
MPFLYIHGVNVRDEKASLQEASHLVAGLVRHVVRPLAREQVGRFSEFEIEPEPLVFPVYWGDVGVRFAWGLRSLPRVGMFDALGGFESLPADLEPKPQLRRSTRAHANSWSSAVMERIREFLARLRNAPIRLAIVTALTLHRAAWNDELARFTGDVFHYLRHRGDRNSPGEIVKRVLAELDRAQLARPGEPLFIITHSMGGNIFLDVINHFRPDLQVEVWISVGGQVGIFEEMKLFQDSDPRIRHPLKVDEPGGRLQCWLNVYDPADPFSYLAGEVFSSVSADVCYRTGAGGIGAHTSYFRQRSFYEAVREKIRESYLPNE